MRESDLMYSRRRFLLTSVRASTAVAGALILGPEVFEALDRMGPRRLIVAGSEIRVTIKRQYTRRAFNDDGYVLYCADDFVNGVLAHRFA